MVVQHNLTAMNSNRMLGVTTSSQAKSTEKLSSGYKINRAADDAAGLSISEKMRKQIRGLTQASLNAEDGISAVQTAEGALNEVQDMLQRMNELAVKASNGSMSENDRSYIQDEVDALLTEIDRVAETTKFNETYLLKGNAEGTSSEVTVNAHDAGLAGKLVDNGDGTTTFTADGLQADGTLADGTKVTIAGKEYTIDAAASGNGTALSAVKDAIDAAKGTGSTVKVTPAGGGTATTYTYAAATTYTQTDVQDLVTEALADIKEGDSVTVDGKEYKYVGETVATGSLSSKFPSSAAAGDTITIFDKSADTTTTYTYKDAEYGVGNASNDKLDEVYALTSLSAGNGDTITITTAGGTSTVYTYDGGESRWEDNMGAEVDLSTITMAADTTVSFVDADNSANNKSYKFIAGATNNAAGFYTDGVSTPLANFSGLGLATDDKVTITIDGDASSFTVGSADKAAGLYEDGDNTKAALATGTITATSEMEINVADSENNGKTVKVGDEKTAAGYYDDDDNALPEDIAAGSEVEITPAGGEAQEFTVADLSSGKINTAGALDLMKAELEAASSIGAAKQAATAAVETDGTITITQGKVDVKDGLSFGLHVGADADMTNKIRVDIDSMSAAGLGVVGLNVKDATGMAATYAIDAIQDAIQKVSTQRSALGAVQNRLEHTIANLDNVVENTTAAESQIRDTDMASEMVKYSNNNILAQAGTSMLAQANQSNQNILSLLG